ncbi:putative protein phosphatase 2C 6 [Acorus calamus]|uniref:protein-serine/threonine phosphatase n=1 Tax=Acorus calamus TaxID=4465 RepID=A0AAV9EK89_ACOCL|nr:putative protein phosphatase 2C 6 [Acorus calamus]
MDEMSPAAVAVPFRIGSSLCDGGGGHSSTRMEITRLKIITDAAPPLSLEAAEVVVEEEGGARAVAAAESEEDDCASVEVEAEPVVGGGESGGIVVSEAVVKGAEDVRMLSGGDSVSEAVVTVGSTSVCKDNRVAGGAMAVEYVPLWGCSSICGRRAEMEDAFAVVPRFLPIPRGMLTGDRMVNGLNLSSSHLTAHFFGVYDGHGGAQVANYCKERMHFALVEEVGNLLEEDLGSNNSNSGNGVDLMKQWEKAFTRTFLKVDDEVGGRAGRGGVGSSLDGSEEICVEPVAPETVGTTAVVAVICSSHIIIANCGDSRAVLLRGKQPVPLSVDHKPNREDEYARIEAAGGKVIQWNGYRVFGVLAMSRSIGDRYLKPMIIPDPEVTFVPRMREDECLILASDGLWDVMSNEEACDVARKCILHWHKRNGVTPSVERGIGADPATQAAADYLSKYAIQKGSKDNITVIVVDLKAQRKFKRKT